MSAKNQILIKFNASINKKKSLNSVFHFRQKVEARREQKHDNIENYLLKTAENLSSPIQPVKPQSQVFAAPPPMAYHGDLYDGIELLHMDTPDKDALEELIRLVKANKDNSIVDSLFAKHLKEALESKSQFGKHWQVVVGSHTFGCAVA